MFLARTDEQRRFAGALGEVVDSAPAASPSQVFLVHGLGGMGKTELCNRFFAIARGEVPAFSIDPSRFLVTAVNWQDERRNGGLRSTNPGGVHPAAVLAAIHDAVTSALSREGGAAAQFGQVAFGPYTQTAAGLRDPNPLSPPVRPAISSQAGAIEDPALLGPVGAQAGLDLPSVGGAVQVVREGRHPAGTVPFILERAQEAMTRRFADGLRDLSERKALVIILDHYEIVTSCSSWIRRAMLASGPRVLWIVAARLEAEEEAGSRGELAAFVDTIPEQNLRIIEMSTFKRKTIEEELEQRNVLSTDKGTLEGIEELTRGIPLAVSLVSKMLSQGDDLSDIGRAVTKQGDTTRLVRELAERYLIHTIEDPALAADAPLLLGLSLLYVDRGDPDILRGIWGDQVEVERTLSDLSQRHDFVLSGSRRLHQLVRDTFRRYLLDGVRRPERRSANERAAEIGLRRANDCVSNAKSWEENVAKEEWRLNTATWIWHSFWVDNSAGFDALLEVFPAAVLLHRVFAHELVQIASFFKDTLSEEQRVLLRGLASLLSFGSFIDGWAVVRQRQLRRETELEASSGDQNAALTALRARAGDQGATHLSDSVPVLVSLIGAKSQLVSAPSVALADLTAISGKLDRGLPELASQAAVAAKDLTNALVEPGPDGRTKVPSAQAMRAGELWLSFTSNPSSVRLWFGDAHTKREEWDEALAVYDELEKEASSLSPQAGPPLLSRVLAGRAVLLRRQKRFKDEVDCYGRILELAEGDETLRRDCAYALSMRAIAYKKLGRDTDALADNLQVHQCFKGELEPKIRGKAIDGASNAVYLYEVAEQHEEALALLNDVLDQPEDRDPEVRFKVAGLFIQKTFVLSSLRDWEGAAATCDEALERFGAEDSPSYRILAARCLRNKGMALAHQGFRYEAAVEAFDEVVKRVDQIDNPEARRLVIAGLFGRAEALLRMEREFSVDEVKEKLAATLAGGPVPKEALFLNALFLMEVGENPEVVEVTFEKLIEAEPEDANHHANYARFRFEQGEIGEGIRLSREALSKAEVAAPAKLEVRFYLSLLGEPEQRQESLEAIKGLLDLGYRSFGWNFERLIDLASRQGDPNVDHFRDLAAVVNGRADAEVLSGWGPWA
jgi:tetratricopeptide (TPR) repeat protein